VPLAMEKEVPLAMEDESMDSGLAMEWPCAPTRLDSDDEDPPSPVSCYRATIHTSPEQALANKAKENEIEALRLETNRLKMRRHSEEQLHRDLKCMSVELNATKQQLQEKVQLVQQQVTLQLELEHTAKQLLVQQRETLESERIAQVDQMRLKHSQLESQAQTLTEETRLLRQAKGEQQQQLIQLEQALELKADAVLNASEWQVEVQTQVSSLSSNIAERETELKMLSEVMQHLQQEKTSVEEELRAVEEQFTVQRTELTETVQDLQGQLQLTSVSPDHDQPDLQFSLNLAKKEITELEAEHEARTQALLAEQSALQQELEQMKAQKEGIMSMLCELEAEVSAEFVQKQTQYDKLKLKSTESLKKQSRELRVLKQELKMEQTRAETEATVLRDQIEDLENDVDTKSGAVAAWAAELAAEVEAHANSSATMAQLCKREAAVQMQLVAVKQTLRKETRKRDKLIEDEKAKQAQLTNAHESERALMEREIQLVRQELSRATKLIHEMELEISQLSLEKHECSAERAVLETARARLDSSVASMRVREEELRQQLEDAEESSGVEVDSLQEELEAVEHRASAVETELQKVQLEMEQLEERQPVQISEMALEQLQQLENTNGELENQLAEVTTQLEMKTVQLNSGIRDTILSHQLAAEARCELEETVNSMSEELEQETAAHALTKSELETMRDENQRLNRQLDDSDEDNCLKVKLIQLECDKREAQQEARSARHENEVLQRAASDEQAKLKKLLVDSTEKEDIVQRQLNEMLQLLLQLPSDAQESLLGKRSYAPHPTVTASSDGFPTNPATAAGLEKLRQDRLTSFERLTPRSKDSSQIKALQAMLRAQSKEDFLEPKRVNAALARINRHTPRGEANPR